MKAFSQQKRLHIEALPKATIWERFSTELSHELASPETFSAWVKKTLPRIHKQLLQKKQYRHYIEVAKQQPLLQYNLTLPLFKDNTISVNMVAFEKGRPLPYHDHPGAKGLMLVISGIVKVCNCNVKNINNNITEMLVNQITELHHDDTEWFTETLNNIHSLESISQRSVLLTIHTPAFLKQNQSFYFPLDNYVYEGVKLQAQRISAHAMMNTIRPNVHPQMFDHRHTN